MNDRVLIEWVPWSRKTRTVWDSKSDDLLWLLLPEELELLPAGTVVTDITGGTAVYGTDYIDTDTRGGLLAYGLLDSQLPPYRPDVRGEWE